MKITYAQNPLNTTVELDEEETKLLALLLKVDGLEDRVYFAKFRLENYTSLMTLEEAVKDVIKRCTIDDNIFERNTQYYLEALKDSHDGDCVCVACSCLKCRAEDLLGIDTIKGLDKYAAHYIGSAFRESASIDEAIKYLENYQFVNTAPNWPDEDFQAHIPRWRTEVERARTWLISYKKEKLDCVIYE